MSATLAGLLADKDAESPAIGAPGRPWLTYGGLRSLSLDLRRQLRRPQQKHSGTGLWQKKAGRNNLGSSE